MKWLRATDRSPASNLDTREDVAIKLEHISIDPSFLKPEADIYQSLSGGVGIPRVHAFHLECEYRAMVFDLLGPSLEDLFNYCGRKFSLKTVLMLTDQLLRRLEYIHAMDILHRDIKPENFLMGTGRCGNLVYVTDLGLATERINGRPNANPSRPARHHLIGTALFASVNGHLGIGVYSSLIFAIQRLIDVLVQHRCDDLESLGYMLVYFLRGSLPWQKLKGRDQAHKEELILEKKKAISAAELSSDLPKEFVTYFDHIRSLDFDQKPAYAFLRKVFNRLFIREGFEHDNVFDWTILRYLQLHNNS